MRSPFSILYIELYLVGKLRDLDILEMLYITLDDSSRIKTPLQKIQKELIRCDEGGKEVTSDEY